MLAQLGNIGSPAMNSLTCLESNEADTGQVYLFWDAIVRYMLDILQSKEHRFPIEVQDEICTIIYYHHKEIMCENGWLYSPIYLAAAYLNPGTWYDVHLQALDAETGLVNLASDVFMPDPLSDSKLLGIPNVMLHQKVSKYLNNFIKAEIHYGNRPVFTKWKGKGQVFAQLFKEEITRYSWLQYPFQGAVDELKPLGILEFWCSKIGMKGAEILPVCGLLTSLEQQWDTQLLAYAAYCQKGLLNPCKLNARWENHLQVHSIDAKSLKSAQGLNDDHNDTSQSVLSDGIQGRSHRTMSLQLFDMLYPPEATRIQTRVKDRLQRCQPSPQKICPILRCPAKAACRSGHQVSSESSWERSFWWQWRWLARWWQWHGVQRSIRAQYSG